MAAALLLSRERRGNIAVVGGNGFSCWFIVAVRSCQESAGGLMAFFSNFCKFFFNMNISCQLKNALNGMCVVYNQTGKKWNAFLS
jgi:hypothetical protein